MERNQETPAKIKILFSPCITIGVIFGLLMGLGVILFCLCYEPVMKDVIFTAFMVSFFSIFIILILVLGARSIFSIITIDEFGVHRSFLGRFFKLNISWDEMKEVFFINGLAQYIWFSKTETLSTINYWKRHKVKDTIPISISKKRLAVIKQYIKQPIVGLEDESIIRK